MSEPFSRDKILRRERDSGNIHFPCSADHEQNWQPYPVDPHSAISDGHTYTYRYCCKIDTPEQELERRALQQQQYHRSIYYLVFLRSRGYITVHYTTNSGTSTCTTRDCRFEDTPGISSIIFFNVTMM